MKQLTLLILMGMISSLVYSQKRDNFWLKQGISSLSYMTSGFFFRRAEIRKDDYRRYAAVHPNANPQWASPKLSFRNKYKNWPTDQREAYFGSKTIFVAASDGFHCDNTIAGACMVTGAAVSLSLWEKPRWKQILLQAAVSYISYTSGRAMADIIYPKI